MKLKRVAIIIVVVALIFGLGSLGIHVMSKNLAQRVIVNNVELVNLLDGEFIGAWVEVPIEVEVKVVIRDNTIKDVEILKHQKGMGGSGESIVESILENQSLDVDTISGATASSKVILKAVEDALLKAKGN